MKIPFAGAIDCDLHPAVPDVAALRPYLDAFWREHLAECYIDQSPFTLASYAPPDVRLLPANARIANSRTRWRYLLSILRSQRPNLVTALRPKRSRSYAERYRTD